MTVATDVVRAARYEVGTTEHPAGSNCNPYSKALGRPCEFWCADFTAWVLKSTDADVPSGVLTASTRMNLSAWRQSLRFIKPADLQPGDVVFFHISGRNGNDPNTPDHTGIVVEAPKAGHLLSVEGNTSDTDHGSQDNGGGVYLRTRRMGVVIGGGRPYYDTEPPQPTPQPEEDDMFILNPVTDAPDTTQYFVNGTEYVALTADEAQQFRNSGFATRDMEPLAFKIFKQTSHEVARP